MVDVEKFFRDGYVIVEGAIDAETIDAVKRDITAKVNEEEVKTQADGFHYSESPRVFEAWKFSKAVRDVACNQKVMDTVKELYGVQSDIFPFQTINFIKGSNQPLHSDSIHFYTEPEGWMVGTWAAFEDMDEGNGTLRYVPGSHKLPHVDFPMLGMSVPEYGKEMDHYRKYEDYVRERVKQNGLEETPLICKKGDVIIWASRLFHGGLEIKDPSRTRWSQATHYYFSGCEKYYSPMYSDKMNGVFSEKDLSSKTIINYED